ncbi:MAG TPA: YtxH domain-containing protein [Planktothrix sp.]
MARLGIWGGPIALAGVLLFGTEPGRKFLKKVSREATKVGVQAYDKVKELATEAREEAQHLIEEAKSEKNNGKPVSVD